MQLTSLYNNDWFPVALCVTSFHRPRMRMKTPNSCPPRWRHMCPPDRSGSWWQEMRGLYWTPPICPSLCNTPWCGPDGRPPETRPARRWQSPRPRTSPSRPSTASETPSSTRYCRSRSTPPSPDHLRGNTAITDHKHTALTSACSLIMPLYFTIFMRLSS